MTRKQAIDYMYKFLWPEAHDEASPSYVAKVMKNATKYVDSAPGKPIAYGLAREQGSSQDFLLLSGQPGKMTHVLDPYIAAGWVTIAQFDRDHDFEFDKYDESTAVLGQLIHEIVSAQHTVYHTAPIYEDEIEEISSGGVIGTTPYKDLDEDDADIEDCIASEIVKRCKKG